MAGGVQPTTARRLGHGSTHGLTRLSTTQAGGRGHSFPHRPPGLFSFLHQLEAKQRGFTGRNSSWGAGKHLSCRGHYGVAYGQREGGSMWLEVHLSRLFAKVNWGGCWVGEGEPKILPKKEGNLFSFVLFFLFLQKDSKKFVSNLNTRLCRSWY